MKKSLMALAFVLSTSVSASAIIVPSHYQVDYEISGQKSLCGINELCSKFAVEVKITATLAGCLDKVVYTDFKVVKKNGTATIRAIGIAKVDPRSASVRCYRANTDTRTMTIVDDSYFDIQIKNESVQF